MCLCSKFFLMLGIVVHALFPALYRLRRGKFKITLVGLDLTPSGNRRKERGKTERGTLISSNIFVEFKQNAHHVEEFCNTFLPFSSLSMHNSLFQDTYYLPFLSVHCDFPLEFMKKCLFTLHRAQIDQRSGSNPV